VAFNVKSVEGAFSEALRWHLAPFVRPKLDFESIPVWVYIQEGDADDREPQFSYFRDEVIRKKERSQGALFEYARWDIHAHVPERARDYLILHAGAVVRDGRALLLPGPPEAGKSSLVLALLQRGFDYLSDDVGAIDPVTSRVYPFEKRIGVRESTIVRYFPELEPRLEDRGFDLGDHLRQRFVRPEDAGATVGGPTQAGSVVFLGEDREGAPRLTPLSRAAAVEGMAANAFNLFRYGDRGVILLSRVAAETEAYLLEGGTAVERAELLAERVLPSE
jgi:hypothetical protein